MNEDNDFQAHLIASFPIAGFLGAEVVDVSPSGATIGAHYGDCCRNPHATVFGGATACFALLAGWLTLYARLSPEDRNWSIAVRRFTGDYVSPIRSHLLARAFLPEDFDLSGIAKKVERHGMAAIEVPTIAQSEGNLAYRGVGQFVIHRDAKAGGLPYARKS